MAGNVVSAEVLGSIQYAGSHLRTPLFVVLGHEGCGAVGAALAAKFYGATTTRKRIRALLRGIVPGLAGIDPALPSEEQLRVAVEANLRWSMRQLEETPEARRALAERRATLAGAVYELRTGRVRILDAGRDGLGTKTRRTPPTGSIPLKRSARHALVRRDDVAVLTQAASRKTRGSSAVRYDGTPFSVEAGAGLLLAVSEQTRLI